MPKRTKKTQALRPSSILLELAGHAAMGVALGLGYTIALIFFDAFGVKALIAHSDEPRTTMMIFAGMFTLAFGVGATLTGLVFMMMEDR
jgi:hypothetical protein